MKIEGKKEKKNKKAAIIFASVLSAWIIVVIILFFYSKGIEPVYAVSTNPKEMQQKDNSLNLDGIIQENTKEKVREEKVTEEMDLEYTTVYQESSELAKGKIQVVQEGKDGKQNIVITKTYQGEELIKEEQTGSVVTEAAINRIVEIGTGNFRDNYKPKKEDILYVVSDMMEVRSEPNKTSEKLITLTKNKQVTYLQQQDGWFQIQYGSYTGWVDGQCLTNQTQKQQEQEATSEGVSKANALGKLSKNIDLRTPSGLSLEQFKKILSGIKEDKYGIFEGNAEYFYYIEKQYKVNGIFVAAVGIHESNWGASEIARNKKNLFGYGASDSNPYNNAYTFKNYSEGIDLIARVFVKYYLNPAGTKIYNNETASGKYYSGTTLQAVNKKYASDSNWNNAVYKWMSYLYNRI